MSSPAPSGYGFDSPGLALGCGRTRTPLVCGFSMSATVDALRMRAFPSCPPLSSICRNLP